MKRVNLDKPLLLFLVEDMAASDRTKNRLWAHSGADTPRQLCRMTEAELRGHRRIDITVYRELTDGLAEYGLALGMSDAELDEYGGGASVPAADGAAQPEDIMETLRNALLPLLAVLFPDNAGRVKA